MIKPKLSVLLPAHRCDEYLISAIKSVLNQSFVEFELILILNGTPIDDRIWLGNQFDDSRLKIVHTSIANLVFSLNLGIHFADSDYIVRMDSDDICKEYRLAFIWEIINSNPDIDVIGSSFDIIDTSGYLIKRSSIKKMTSCEIKKFLPFRCVIPHPTVAFKKESVLKIGGYGYGRFSEDYDLWLRMMRSSESRFLITEEPLIEYRVHDLQATSSNNDLNILAYDLSLKIRELIITKRLIYIPGIFFTIIDFIYKKINNFLGKHR